MDYFPNANDDGRFGNTPVDSADIPSPRAIISFDVDLDERRDILVASKTEDSVFVFLNTPSALFEQPRVFGVGEEPFRMAHGDVDNDGDQDLIVANRESGSVSVLFNTAIELLGSPDDMDGDGVLDDVDNCPERRNLLQNDFDSDGIGDACDPDIDNDGVSNGLDRCDFTPAGGEIQPDGTLATDADGDCDVDLRNYAIMQRELTGPGK